MQQRSTYRRVADRLRFGLELLVLRGTRYRLLLAAAVVSVVAVVFGVLVLLVDASFSGPGESVWWAFLRLTDPGYLGDDEGVARRSISTVVTVLGYVLFLGLLIAILTQWLNETIAKLESGVTPIALSDHVVILGWTHRVPTIVSELLLTRGRVRRFLARRNARDLRIVILAEHVNDALVQELRERLGDLWSDRRVFVRSGTPLRLDHLERVACQDAAVIILPGADFAESRPETVDAQTVKTLMTVSRNVQEAGSVAPLAVAEIFDARKASVASQSYGGASEIVVADDIVSRMIAQSVRKRGLCTVLSELLTLNLGNAIYVGPMGDQAGVNFHQLCGAFPRAVLLGTVRSTDRHVALNPHPDTVLTAEDCLVFIARRFEDCARGPARPSALPTQPRGLRPAVERKHRLLLLGWSRKVPALLQEFQRYGKDAFDIDVVSSTPLDERERQLARHGSAGPNDAVRQIEASPMLPHVLEQLEPRRYDNIVLLASERLTDEESADATTVFIYQLLRGLLPEEGPRPELLVELLDEENLSLFSRDRDDVIVSSLLTSYVLSQVALRRELAAVFAELFRPWGAQVVLQSAREYLAADGPVRFGDFERAAAERGEIALGVWRGEGPDRGLALNPDRDTEWVVVSSDLAVVLTSYAEAESEA